MIDQWVEALRSGKYKQGKGCLRYGDNYCCLGVLCEVAGIPAVPNGPYFSYQGHVNTVPNDLGKQMPGVNWHSLVLKNDYGMSFNEIADLLDWRDPSVYRKPDEVD